MQNQPEVAKQPMSLDYKVVFTKKNFLYEDDNEETPSFTEKEHSYNDDVEHGIPAQMSLSSMFNLWNMHTNFKITKEIFLLVKDFDGVEVVAPISPYRMKVGFGLCFKDKIVRNRLNYALSKLLEKRNE